MFYGTHTCKVDDAGRVPIPAKFRRELKGIVILTHLADKCITAYPLAEWEKMGKSLVSSSLDRAKARRLKRVIFGNAFPENYDGQGRVRLDPMLRQYAEIKDTVSIVGMNTYFERLDQETM
jgi:MraZ protein